MVDLVLKNRQGAGDQVLLTALVRDLHASHPQRYRTGVDCWGKELFDNNPLVTPAEQLRDARLITVEGFEIGDDQPHLVGQFARNLSRQLGVAITPGKLGGDVRLSPEERGAPPPFDGEPYWLGWFGGHWGCTTKMWEPRHAQAVVDHFRGRLRFLQCGAQEHFHPEIPGAVQVVGKTPMRRMVQLMYHARGGVGPISFGMHLAAAVPTAPGSPLRRPYVVIAGGRETPSIFGYPNHTILSSIGHYRCCYGGACFANHSDTTIGHKVDCQQPVDGSPIDAPGPAPPHLWRPAAHAAARALHGRDPPRPGHRRHRTLRGRPPRAPGRGRASPRPAPARGARRAAGVRGVLEQPRPAIGDDDVLRPACRLLRRGLRLDRCDRGHVPARQVRRRPRPRGGWRCGVSATGIRAMTTLNIPAIAGGRITELLIVADDAIYICHADGTTFKIPGSFLVGDPVQAAAARHYAYFVDGTATVVWIDVTAGTGAIGQVFAPTGGLPGRALAHRVLHGLHGAGRLRRR
jgi:hypothetical protein